jgi:hypothetical protein
MLATSNVPFFTIPHALQKFEGLPETGNPGINIGLPSAASP